MAAVVPRSVARSAGARSGRKRTARDQVHPPLQVNRALLSVYDKDGAVELARGLSELGVEVLSTGGTARLLIDNGIPVVRITDYTQFPEMLDGRVKTLHPKIHAGIMAVRDNRKHMAQVRRAGIPPIDLVVVNLYPFEKTTAMEGIGFNEIVEMIDIGGPTLVRAAAKNFRDVGVVVDPADYSEILSMLRQYGRLTEERRFELAKKAFQHIASYDTSIFTYFSLLNPDGSLKTATRESPFPTRLSLDFFKDLSFNNLLDLDAAFRIACEFDRPACAAVKHTNPCGVGLGRTASEAFLRAREADPVSLYGGITGFNVEVDLACAQAMREVFLEGIIAPDYSAAALELLRTRKNLRLLRTGSVRKDAPGGNDLRRVEGGLLVQEWDSQDIDPHRGKVVTRRLPTPPEMEALRVAWNVVRHVRSNAIVYANADRTLGIGAGQMSRVDSVRFGALKATGPLEGAVLASDAFLPFRDSVDIAAEAGVGAIVQPGGSIRDPEVIAAADEHGMAMVFTGLRHFKH
ncbi:MAG: bifunctional phosphoribosylaminoimidazolecarboxamide formyltransferase/inosine monophosphate cyclohydrolase [Acidobacteria bacterium]|nr:MAG: bifunctional phosphoribosylaminoimidazolecarboxamide formyltransferase/inosine monophosphate cyclohydrolase [Acidobacteriota bacterium]